MAHLKALTAPPVWKWSERKAQPFVLRTNPGSHPLYDAIPLGLLIKLLGYAKTTREVRAILNRTVVRVNDRRVRNPRFAVGFMDSISFDDIKAHYRLLMDAKGRFELRPLAAAKAGVKLAKVVGKRPRGKDTLQLNLNDGRNVLVKPSDGYAMGDSVVLDLAKKKITGHVKCATGAEAWLTSGKHRGFRGKVKEIKDGAIVLEHQKQQVRALKAHTFVTSGEWEA